MVSLPFEEEFELYHYQESLCSQMVRIALAEKGLPWRSHVVALEEVTLDGDNLTEAYLAINPRGQVPTLVHQGAPVYDSYEIIRYLDQCNPSAGARLVPDDPATQDAMEAWIVQASLRDDAGFGTSLGMAIPMLSAPLIKVLIDRQPVWHVIRKFRRHPVPVRRAGFVAMRLTPMIPALALNKSVRTVAAALVNIEQTLAASSGPYLLGDFNLADVMMMAHFHRLEDVGLEEILSWDRLPQLHAYWSLLQGRDSYQTAVKDWEEDNWRWAIDAVAARAGSGHVQKLKRTILKLGSAR